MHNRCVRRAAALSRKCLSEGTSSTSSRSCFSTSKRIRLQQHANQEGTTSTVRTFDPSQPREVLQKLAPFKERQTISFIRGTALSKGPELDDQLLERQDIFSSGEIEATYTPGSFVEIRRSGDVQYGIVLAEVVFDCLWRVHTLLADGVVLSHRRTDVHFCIPSFISSDLAQRCGAGRAPADNVQASARVETLRRLREVVRAAEFAAHRVARVQSEVNVYDHVSHPEDSKWGETSVQEVAALLYAEPTLVEIFGVHQFLMSDPLRYVAGSNYLDSQLFAVRPRREVEQIERVNEWHQAFRLGRPAGRAFKDFVERAKKVVKRYDEASVSTDGPPTQTPASHSWTPEDTTFLEYLVNSHQLIRNIQDDVYANGRTALTKAIMGGESQVSPDETRLMLVKLGVIAPWQDFPSLMPHFHVNRTPAPGSAAAQKEEESVNATLSNLGGRTPSVLGPEDFYPTDPLEHVRHDFGNLPVYVVDDANAEELDDGISVERIPSEPDNFWIHTHVANPTSLIHPSHKFAHRARERYSTVYFSQGSYPLLCDALVHHPLHGLSLGGRDRTRGFDRTLSFSVKVDRKGDILDKKVRAGIIRNVKTLSYASVDAKLGWEHHLPDTPFDPHRINPLATPADLSPEEIEDIQLLNTLAEAQSAKRQSLGVVITTTPSSFVKRFKLPAGLESPTLKPSIFSGFPQLMYEVRDARKEDTGMRFVVAEMMKLASTVASMFALEHNVPLFRRSVPPLIFRSEEAKEAVLKNRTNRGYVLLHDHLADMVVMPPAVFTTEPLQHAGMGIPDGVGYSRVTSPLRRYEDLIAHWQLQHILLGKNSPRRLPFSKEDLTRLVPEVTRRSQELDKDQQKNIFFYTLWFLRQQVEADARGVERPDWHPFNDLKAVIVKRPLFNGVQHIYEAMTYIPKLGIQARLTDATEALEIGQGVDVDIHAVLLGAQDCGLVVKERGCR